MSAGLATVRSDHGRQTHIRVLTPDDYLPLSKMLAAFPWEGLTPGPWAERLAHWWEDNPAFTSSWQRGWVVEADGGLVGFLGSIPRRIAVDGKVAVSANTTTWWVAPEHRKHSLGLLAAFNRQKAVAHFNTTGSATALKLMAAFGYKLVDEHQSESLIVVDPARLVAQKIRQRAADWRPPGLELLTRVVDAFSPVGMLVQRLRLPAKAGRYYHGEISRVDERFDALAAKLREKYRFTAERDRASVDWYMRGEASDQKHIIACWRGSELAGYALVLQRDSGSMAGLPIFDCIDVVRDEDDPGLMVALLNGLAEAARNRNVPLVVIRHFDSFIARCCRETGLLTRSGPTRRECAKLPRSFDGDRSLITQFHGDFFV